MTRALADMTPEDVNPDPQPGEAWLIKYKGEFYQAVYWYSPLYAHWAFVENREGLKTVESPEATPVSRLVPKRVDTCLAGAEAIEAIGRVRNVLNGIARVKADSEAARDHGYDNTEWHETTADALEYVIDLLTEALKGETE